MDAKTLKEIGVLADIREIMDDSEGKLMQEELVERIRELKKSTEWKPIEKAKRKREFELRLAVDRYLDARKERDRVFGDKQVKEYDAAKREIHRAAINLCALISLSESDKDATI